MSVDGLIFMLHQSGQVNTSLHMLRLVRHCCWQHRKHPVILNQAMFAQKCSLWVASGVDVPVPLPSFQAESVVRLWITDWKIVSSNPGTAKMPVLGPWAKHLTHCFLGKESLVLFASQESFLVFVLAHVCTYLMYVQMQPKYVSIGRDFTCAGRYFSTSSYLIVWLRSQQSRLILQC